MSDCCKDYPNCLCADVFPSKPSAPIDMYYQGPAFHGDKGMLSKNVIQPSAPTDATLPLRRMLNKAVDHYAPKPPKDAGAREWWIFPEESCSALQVNEERINSFHDCVSLKGKEQVHVIEYAAYEKLERSVEREMRLTDRSNARIADLERELAETLEDARNGILCTRMIEAERQKSAALVEALKSVDHHLDFFSHVEKRYKEAGKDKVAFDKCAEIRAAHLVAREALAKWGKG